MNIEYYINIKSEKEIFSQAVQNFNNGRVYDSISGIRDIVYNVLQWVGYGVVLIGTPSIVSLSLGFAITKIKDKILSDTKSVGLKKELSIQCKNHSFVRFLNEKKSQIIEYHKLDALSKWKTDNIHTIRKIENGFRTKNWTNVCVNIMHLVKPLIAVIAICNSPTVCMLLSCGAITGLFLTNNDNTVDRWTIVG